MASPPNQPQVLPPDADPQLSVQLDDLLHLFRHESEMNQNKGDYLTGRVDLPPPDDSPGRYLIELSLANAHDDDASLHPNLLHVARKKKKQRSGKNTDDSEIDATQWRQLLLKDDDDRVYLVRDRSLIEQEGGLTEGDLINCLEKRAGERPRLMLGKQWLMLKILTPLLKGGGKGKGGPNRVTVDQVLDDIYSAEDAAPFRGRMTLQEARKNFAGKGASTLHEVRLRVRLLDPGGREDGQLMAYSGRIRNSGHQTTVPINVLRWSTQQALCANQGGSCTVVLAHKTDVVKAELMLPGDQTIPLEIPESDFLHKLFVYIDLPPVAGLVEDGGDVQASLVLYRSDDKSDACKPLSVVFRRHDSRHCCTCSSSQGREDWSAGDLLPAAPNNKRRVAGVVSPSSSSSASWSEKRQRGSTDASEASPGAYSPADMSPPHAMLADQRSQAVAYVPVQPSSEAVAAINALPGAYPPAEMSPTHAMLVDPNPATSQAVVQFSSEVVAAMNASPGAFSLAEMSLPHAVLADPNPAVAQSSSAALAAPTPADVPPLSWEDLEGILEPLGSNDNGLLTNDELNNPALFFADSLDGGRMSNRPGDKGMRGDKADGGRMMDWPGDKAMTGDRVAYPKSHQDIIQELHPRLEDDDDDDYVEDYSSAGRADARQRRGFLREYFEANRAWIELVATVLLAGLAFWLHDKGRG